MFDLSVIPFFVIASATLIVTPGVDTVLTLKNALSYGQKFAFVTVSGIVVGVSVHSLILISGVGLLIARIPSAMYCIKIGGSFYLFYLACQALNNGIRQLRRTKNRMPRQTSQPGGMQESLTPAKKRLLSLKNPFFQGLFSNVTNPKTLLFFLAFFPQFLGKTQGQQGSTAAQLFLLSAIFILMVSIFYFTVAYGAAKFNAFCSSSAFGVALELVSGLVFAALAGYILLG